MDNEVLLVHIDEIGLKGGNRRWFEDRLCSEIARRLRDRFTARVRAEHSRIIVEFDADDPTTRAEGIDRLARIPGIAWFSTAREVPSEVEAIEAEVLARARRVTGTGPFRITVKRSWKEFPLDTLALQRRLGAAVVEATGRPVDLHTPDDEFRVEVDRRHAYVHLDRRPGFGGLPTGGSGSVIALLSGGLDSPVAAWRMMRRGCRVVAVHFLNNAIGGEGVLEKLDLLGAALARWQGSLDLHIVPFEDLQRAIVAAVPADHRMVVYRRTMLRLAEQIRARHGAGALVTGDAVGQVASQTLENIAAVYAAVPGPILTPLAGDLKREIVASARTIGTFEASALPHQDCCSFLIAKHPVTRARRGRVEAMERDVEWGTLLEDALAATEVRGYREE